METERIGNFILTKLPTAGDAWKVAYDMAMNTATPKSSP